MRSSRPSASRAAITLELASARLGGTREPMALAIGGLYSAQIAAAIALATWVLALLRSGRVHRRHHDVLALVGTYWYFVAGVWVAVWPLIVSPRA